MATVLHLPDEILLGILENLYCVRNDSEVSGNKHHLLSVRLVCKRLARVGEALAFKSIKFVQDRQGIEMLFYLSRSPLRQHVRHLVCYFEDHRKELTLNLNTFIHCFSLRHWNADTQKEVFRDYCRRYRYQALLEDTDLDMAHLAATIPQFSNLRAVTIAQDWRAPWYHGLEDEDLEHFTISATGRRFFDSIVNALIFSDINLESLNLGRRYVPPLLGIIQDITPDKHKLYLTAFRRLKHLYVNVSETDFENINFDGLSILLQSAPFLETLSLDFWIDRPTFPESFLRSFELTGLRTLKLRYAGFRNPSDLLHFLHQNALTLRAIEFWGLGLESGSWETVFMWMRDNLNLYSCYMEGDFVVGSRVEIGNWSWRRGLPSRAVEDFIQQRAQTNPFDWIRSKGVESDSDSEWLVFQ